MIGEYNRLTFINNIVYRITTFVDEERQQLVFTSAYILTVVKYLHNYAGHLGTDRTLSLLRNWFYWPGMYKDTDSWIE